MSEMTIETTALEGIDLDASPPVPGISPQATGSALRQALGG